MLAWFSTQTLPTISSELAHEHVVHSLCNLCKTQGYAGLWARLFPGQGWKLPGALLLGKQPRLAVSPCVVVLSYCRLTAASQISTYFLDR